MPEISGVRQGADEVTPPGRADRKGEAMLSRRWLLSLIGAFLVTAGTHVMAAKAEARNSATSKFVARQGAKSKDKQQKK